MLLMKTKKLKFVDLQLCLKMNSAKFFRTAAAAEII